MTRNPRTPLALLGSAILSSALEAMAAGVGGAGEDGKGDPSSVPDPQAVALPDPQAVAATLASLDAWIVAQPKIVDESLRFAQDWAGSLSDEIIGKMREGLKKKGHKL